MYQVVVGYLKRFQQHNGNYNNMSYTPQIQTDWSGSGLAAIANKPSTFAPTTVTAQWVKIATKTFTDFSTAGVVNTIASGYVLPAKGIVSGCFVDATTLFSGGLLATYTISVGIGSGASIAKYAIAKNVFTGATVGTPNILTGIESTSITTSITLTATSTVANLSSATTGSVDIYLLVGILP